MVDNLTEYGERGFELWNLGGNCEGFGQRLDITGKNSHYVIATSAEDAYPPEVDEDTAVGIYENSGDENQVFIGTVRGVDAVVELINEFCAHHDAN